MYVYSPFRIPRRIPINTLHILQHQFYNTIMNGTRRKHGEILPLRIRHTRRNITPLEGHMFEVGFLPSHKIETKPERLPAFCQFCQFVLGASQRFILSEMINPRMIPRTDSGSSCHMLTTSFRSSGVSGWCTHLAHLDCMELFRSCSGSVRNCSSRCVAPPSNCLILLGIASVLLWMCCGFV